MRKSHKKKNYLRKTHQRRNSSLAELPGWGYKHPSFADLNDQLSNLKEEEKKEFATSYRARSAKDSDSSAVKSIAWSKLHDGNSSKTDAVMDSGCTFPLTTTAVTTKIKTEIIHLKEELNIVEASGKTLDVIGTCKMFLENEILGSREMVEAAAIEGEGSKETLISLDLLKR